MKLRTLDQTAQYFKERDPDTALTRTAIRRMVLAGKIPFVPAGNKRLLDLDTIEDYFYGEVQQPQSIRRVEVR